MLALGDLHDPQQHGYKHIHGATEYRMRLSFLSFIWKTRHDLKHWEKEKNRIYLTNYNQDKAYDSTLFNCQILEISLVNVFHIKKIICMFS